MSEKPDLADAKLWKCARCNQQLAIRKVSVSYMGSSFPVDLPVCPECGQVYVPEALALGKMAEVEKTLEDK
jgi:NAD-dependent SIR2 family protein deacetylase